jgi:hypothetical protein
MLHVALHVRCCLLHAARRTSHVACRMSHVTGPVETWPIKCAEPNGVFRTHLGTLEGRPKPSRVRLSGLSGQRLSGQRLSGKQETAKRETAKRETAKRETAKRETAKRKTTNRETAKRKRASVVGMPCGIECQSAGGSHYHPLSPSSSQPFPSSPSAYISIRWGSVWVRVWQLPLEKKPGVSLPRTLMKHSSPRS